MRSKKYGLEIYGQPNRNAWVSRDASGGNDGAHVTGAEIENGNRLKLTLSDGQLIVASGTISTGLSSIIFPKPKAADTILGWAL